MARGRMPGSFPRIIRRRDFPPHRRPGVLHSPRVGRSRVSELPLVGAILAGGRGTRMGSTAKGLLERTPGQPIIGHLLREMERAGLRDLLILANEEAPYARFGRPVVPDRRPGLGPLAGIEAGLDRLARRGTARGILFLPCDLPALSAREIRRLVEAFRRRPRGVKAAVVESRRPESHPLCCVVHRELGPRVRAALDEGERRVGRLWTRLAAEPVPFRDPRPFRNLNTPADLRAWRRDR